MLAAIHYHLLFSATALSPVMRTRLAVDIRLNLMAGRVCQTDSYQNHGGEVKGSGCGVRSGTIRSLALLVGVAVIGVGMLNVGCLILIVGDGAGGTRMTGVFAGRGVAGITEMLTLVSFSGVRELMRNRIKSAMTGMMMISTLAISPKRVKRK
jgi:hypothetical protein